jgi:EAL domain-containing protein (putative c-di-GMP-specific phosphodiesterase class I)
LRKFNGALQHFGIPARAFELEITENVGILNQPHVIEKLNALCRLGVRIAIDDFGIGYASLAYLHRFPVHTIKIHRSFVKDIGMEDGHYPAVLAIISMARGLGLKLVAEGVDTRSQSAYLQTTGCTTMQGGLFHEAMPYPALMRRLDGSESAKQ